MGAQAGDQENAPHETCWSPHWTQGLWRQNGLRLWRSGVPSKAAHIPGLGVFVANVCTGSSLGPRQCCHLESLRVPGALFVVQTKYALCPQTEVPPSGCHASRSGPDVNAPGPVRNRGRRAEEGRERDRHWGTNTTHQSRTARTFSAGTHKNQPKQKRKTCFSSQLV